MIIEKFHFHNSTYRKQQVSDYNYIHMKKIYSNIALKMSWLTMVFFSFACSQETDVERLGLDLMELPSVEVQAEIERGSELPVRHATIAFTGELRGELQPCGCPTVPYGGFSRREQYLSQLSGEGRPVFQFDAGDALLKGVSSDRSYVEERSSAILDLMRLVGVDVMVPGPSDFAAVGLGRLGGDLGFSVVSATWANPDGSLVFSGSKVITKDGFSIGVVGLSAPVLSESEGAPGWIDPVVAATQELEGMPQVDLVVAVSNLGPVENARIAEEVDGLAMIMSGVGGSSGHTGGTPVIETPARGRYVSTVRLRIASDSSEPVRSDPNSVAPVVDFDRWEESRRRVLGLSAAVDVAEESLERSSQTLSARADLLEISGLGLNLGLIEDRPLGTAFDVDEENSHSHIRVQSFLRSVENIAEASVAEVSTIDHDVGEYQTSAGCVACHSGEFARWTFTDHKLSTINLTATGEQENPECLGCHTTGYGEPGGFAEANQFNLSRFGGIQCEACHGPLSNHPDSGSPPPVIPGEETCLGCHDEANSPDFNYQEYQRGVVCHQE
jgi:hypothetical protein